jgi:hypothetical protein
MGQVYVESEILLGRLDEQDHFRRGCCSARARCWWRGGVYESVRAARGGGAAGGSGLIVGGSSGNGSCRMDENQC